MLVGYYKILGCVCSQSVNTRCRLPCVHSQIRCWLSVSGVPLPLVQRFNITIVFNGYWYLRSMKTSHTCACQYILYISGGSSPGFRFRTPDIIGLSHPHKQYLPSKKWFWSRTKSPLCGEHEQHLGASCSEDPHIVQPFWLGHDETARRSLAATVQPL